MKIQLAYKFSGEDRDKVIKELKGIVKVLENNSHDVYCPVLDENTHGLSKSDSIRNAFSHLKDTDVLVAWVKSSDKSEGQLLESGYAFGRGKEFILIVQQDAETSLRGLANRVIEYDNYNDLLKKLKEI